MTPNGVDFFFVGCFLPKAEPSSLSENAMALMADSSARH